MYLVASVLFLGRAEYEAEGTMQKQNSGWLRRFFWDSAKESENWAQTLLRVLGNLFRTSATFFVLLGAVSLLAIVAFGELERRAAANDPENFISATVSIGPKGCSSDAPWNIRVTNNSKEVLRYAEFKLTMREKGSSRSLTLDDYSSTLIVQRFVPPAYGYQFCTDAFNRAVVAVTPDIHPV